MEGPSSEDSASQHPQFEDYACLRLLDEDLLTQTYEAFQKSVGRTVALVLLKESVAQDPMQVQVFREEVLLKASVSLPEVAAVYEVCTEEGRYFYTKELLAGKTLEEIGRSGESISLRESWALLEALGRYFKHLDDEGIYRLPLSNRALSLDQKKPMIENLASLAEYPGAGFREALEIIDSDLRPLIEPKQSMFPKARAFWDRVQSSHPVAFKNWDQVLKSLPVEEGLAGGEPDRSRKKAESTRRPFPWAATLLGATVLSGVLAAVYWKGPKPKLAQEFVSLSNEGEVAPLKMGKRQVTIAQYATFLKALESESAEDYAHPSQPLTKTDYFPKHWKAYHAAAKRGGWFEGKRLFLDSPIFYVDWWDAYTYAAWSGGRLPKREDYERATQYREGLIHLDSQFSEWLGEWGYGVEDPHRRTPLVISLRERQATSLSYPGEMRAPSLGFRICP